MNSYSKKKLIKKIDPNGVGQTGKLFGLPFDQKSAEIVVIPVPWDVTTSFNDGASLGPNAVLQASSQIDLSSLYIKEPWTLGIYMLPIEDAWISKNNQARKYAKQYIKFLEGAPIHLSAKDIDFMLQNINLLSVKINDWVYQKAQHILSENKIPVVLGGDHSSPFGLVKAIAAQHEEFGVLQIDAHADLRPSYEGFKFSHASIMNNILKFPQVTKLVQVGIRDFCEQEYELMTNDPRVAPFFGQQLAKERFEGENWSAQVTKIIKELPDLVYISLDVDGLEQSYNPSTGTPVPGGLTYDQVDYLLHQLVISDKRIISFDLCEISGKNADWDALVGSRLLYNMANLTAVSQDLLEFR